MRLGVLFLERESAEVGGRARGEEKEGLIYEGVGLRSQVMMAAVLLNFESELKSLFQSRCPPFKMLLISLQEKRNMFRNGTKVRRVSLFSVTKKTKN